MKKHTINPRKVTLPLSVPSSISADYDLSSRWVEVSHRLNYHRNRGENYLMNEEIAQSALKDKGSPIEPFLHLWQGDNHCMDGSYSDAMKVYEKSIKSAGKPGEFHPHINLLPHALDQFAKSASYSGNPTDALSAWKQLASRDDKDMASMLSAAKYFESIHNYSEASFFYEVAAGKSEISESATIAQFAKRALLRMKGNELFYPSAAQIKYILITALSQKNVIQLEKLLSPTHGAVCIGAGHFHFMNDKFRSEIISELVTGGGEMTRSHMGMGEKFYFYMNGFNGKLLKGEVGFLITRSAYGWQWSGVILPNPPAELLAGPGTTRAANTIPLPFAIKAPWPAGTSMMAGGLSVYLIQQAAILAAAAAWPFGTLAAAALTAYYASRDTGFGLRGFYYNGGSTHDDDDYYAIDFTRYRRFVPYDNESGGTPVLAVADGIVSNCDGSISSGDSSVANFVTIDHNDPLTGMPRYYSRYLHLSGPGQLNVSMGTNVLTGYQLGKMNDTGNSAIDHLHFSLHDRNASNQSIRPSPMDGVELDDNDSGKIVLSTNVMRAPLITYTPSNFQSKHFLVLPGSNFRSPSELNFVIKLSGVAIIEDFLGSANGSWHHAKIHLSEYLMDMNKVQNRVNSLLPALPPSRPDGSWPSWAFVPLQWTIYASFNSIFNAGASINSGYEIDDWKIARGDRAINSSETVKVFEGVEVDLSVRDRDGKISKIGYNVNLHGYFQVVWNPAF